MPSHAVRKTYGTVSADRQREMSGLEFVQGLVDGTLPLNTIAEILGYDVIEAAKGRVVVAITPNGTHLNPAGTVHGGLAATLLDSCMGLATILGAGQSDHQRSWQRLSASNASGDHAALLSEE